MSTTRPGDAGQALIAERGAGMELPQLGTVLAADCPKTQATSPAERCFVIFPQPGPANSAAHGQVEQRRPPFRAQSGPSTDWSQAPPSPAFPRGQKLIADPSRAANRPQMVEFAG